MTCRQRPGAKCSRVDPNKSLGGGPYPNSLARPMTSEHPPGRRRSAANYGGMRRKFPLIHYAILKAQNGKIQQQADQDALVKNGSLQSINVNFGYGHDLVVRSRQSIRYARTAGLRPVTSPVRLKRSWHD